MDALVSAAGVSSGIGDPIKVVTINFIGLRELTERLIPRMAPGSYIVSTSSIAAAEYREHPEALDLAVTPGWDEALTWCERHSDALGAGYSLSKEAVIYYTKRRAVDLAGKGIRINCTAPGVTMTPIIEATVARVGQGYLDAVPKPLGRVATADEQARVLAFLAGPGASYLSGQAIWVDGGYRAGVDSGALEHLPVSR
ncbi:SDR family oxidoreductase [Actinoallomurus sp. NBC_01490]|uniref:SDR family oxidoreductase n=1 Tax=Actinoallomurus sp. NBC_01490 TaxID=2903557 RepID=UPI002E30472A|nr:SDR family oxidoreductase [Actinoallomurus sp. NBC_01490]